MGLGGGNLDKIALVHIAIGFQLHALDMATSGKFGDYGNDEDRDAAIKAFLILAFISYLAAFVLGVLINFGNLSEKIAKIITVVLCFVGVACCVIGISVYAAARDDYRGEVEAFPFTVYVMGFTCIGVGGVLMLLAMLN